ncbi:hypothetical protein [Thermomonospora amylolytica]|uniref:hypothetical protein n=1 Tax=Thermomonospora amylolytica TaxID=1411117 RepID=UPI001F3E606D|nr:hypothetical protein [Thermomonospora amylolytica]
MASIVTKIRRFLHTPQGRQARAHAERLARDPRARAKLRGLMGKRGAGGRRH